MENVLTPKKIFLSVAIVLCFLFFAVTSHGGNIMVKPGKFDHFSVQLPDKARAGEGFMVRLQAYDAHENPIVDFAETGKDFKVSVSGSAQAQPSILKAQSFTGGVAGITVADKKAETITLSVFEVNGTVPVMTREITIAPNKLDHFFVQSPQSVTAGTNFDVKMIAKDAFGNSISDPDIEAKNIRLNATGSTAIKVINMVPIFRDGVGMATITSEKVGEFAVEVYDSATGSRGMSNAVKVTPAALSHFKVQAPKEVVAGEPFDLIISAFDVFDNPVDNYSSYGSGVNISATGQGKPAPASIGQAEFRGGQAVAKVTYEKAEEISLIVTENNKSQQGRSTPVKISPSSPESFVVSTPDTAVAGQSFKIKIESYDKYNNLVKNYNLIGNDVYLNVTGSGTLSPKAVPASEFTGGIATIGVVYDKAESFSISASTSGKREEKKIAVKERKKEELKAPAKQQPVTPVEKSLEKPAEKKAEKQAVVPEKPVQKKVEKPAVPVKEEKVAVKKEEKKEAPKEPVKEKEKKAADKLFEITKVSLIEAKNKAMVIVNMKSADGNLEYKDRIESKQGKDYIVMNLKPAASKTKNSWKFKSAFIREVRIDEDKALPGVVVLKIETASKQVTFDINRVKDSLVISIANP